MNGRRVLVRCYHGLGDTIQLVRFLRQLRARAARTILWAQPALLPLLGTAAGIDELRALHEGEAGGGWEVDLELMELPHLLRVTPATLSARVPYLHVPPAPQEHDGTRHVGLVWAAGDWAPDRSMRFADVAPLADVPGITWHVPQRGAPLAERDPAFGRLDLDDSIVGTARRMRALDLVVTVDSMPAHLAGALGVPVWTLVPARADWRWMRGRRTPWYPTMRLVRQRRTGHWEGVVARVARALGRALSPSGRSASRS